MELFELAMYKAMNGGGGGESYLNPKITFTITEKPDFPFSVAITDLILIEDNRLIPLLTGATGWDFSNETYEGYAIATEEGEPQYFGCLVYEGGEVTYTSELVNCTLIAEDNHLVFLVTDPTQDASATIAING